MHMWDLTLPLIKKNDCVTLATRRLIGGLKQKVVEPRNKGRLLKVMLRNLRGTLMMNCLFLIVGAILVVTRPAFAQIVEIPDPNLRHAVREALTLSDDMLLTQQEMLRLTQLEAPEKHIKDLTGLEHATNLKWIDVHRNNISNLKPLAELTQLERLGLWVNPISDLSPLANLTKLRGLDLAGCYISDIAPVANLTQLEWLTLGWQQDHWITDITSLANLTKLRNLRLSGNRIVDISPLANLTQLTDLTLANNAITDFQPLFGLNLQSVDIDIHKAPELASSEIEIPDPNLRQALREALALSDEIPITQLDMLQLTGFAAEGAQIETLTGLEYAKNLKVLILNNNPIQDLTSLSSLTQLELLQLPGVPINDLTPIKNLTQLKELSLSFCGIRDIGPLANLTQLIVLILSGNDIVDVSPLANLTVLEELWLDRNHIVDLSPVQGLSLTDFRYDEVCVLPAPLIQDRIANRSLPSIVQLHGGIVTLPTLSHADTISEREDHISYHDLFTTHLPFGLRFTQALPWSQLTAGNLATGADLDGAIAKREEFLAKNPNMLFLAEIRINTAQPVRQYPEDWFGWVRDEHGNPVSGDRFSSSPIYLIDIRLPEVQDIIIEQAISVAACGLYDGIFFDWWWEGDFPLAGNWNEDGSVQFWEIVDGEIPVSILQRIRANVRDDFLIMFNSNRRQIPSSVSYINGSFMETFPRENGYTQDDIIEIESSLIWYEANVREPKINCLRALGIGAEPPDSPRNKQWMRLFTTMSLTLSDGYALYTLGHIGGQKQYQRHIWHSFWDADIGQPIGSTVQPHENIEGLYIREFTNGWAVYNRSGSNQTVLLPSHGSSVSDRGDVALSLTHQLPDLDGEIYLKVTIDRNGDGVVNILDLILVSNQLGTPEGDVNRDGMTNILDLTLVAQQLSQ